MRKKKSASLWERESIPLEANDQLDEGLYLTAELEEGPRNGM